MADALFANQVETLKLWEDTNILFDMSDPGTGKTRVVVKAYTEHVHPGKLFVACTKSTMQSVWEREVMYTEPSLQVQILGASARGKQGLDLSKDVFVFNHDGIKWLRQELSVNRRLRTIFGESMLANDESTYYKHNSSARSRAAAAVAKCFKYRTNLSGAPMTRSVLPARSGQASGLVVLEVPQLGVHTRAGDAGHCALGRQALGVRSSDGAGEGHHDPAHPGRVPGYSA